MKILVITRKNTYSPNHIGNDAAILNAVCDKLTLLGADIEICSEDDFLKMTVLRQELIVSMGRSMLLLERLQALEDAGVRVINSAFGVANCFRKNMTLALLQAGVPYPRSKVLQTTELVDDTFAALQNGGVWLKRGDFHAIHKEDVSFAASAKEAQQILQEYALRGITEAVVSEHLHGDLLKFYAVRGTDFFYWFYPYEFNHHKYTAYEAINGKPVHYPFDLNALKHVAHEAARVLQVEIYGGDVIIGPNGDFHLIDLNDWPSFAPCRAEAATAITAHLLQSINQHTQQTLFPHA
ncbi:hypothetical protein ACL9RF_06035 [Sphingobacterium sp. Mn56C]|uniref:hypothetical protein n=1 Tax=Sphingobacterium sp. Mn56C TaxID=3395261 RepID=UPI003BCFE27C